MTQRIALSALAVALVGLCMLSTGRAQGTPEPEEEPKPKEKPKPEERPDAPDGEDAPAKDAPDGGTLRVPFFGNTGTLDPHACRDAVSFRLVATAYETLYMWAPGEHPQVVPCLASGWPEISEDGLTHTIKLRDDARYHNSYIFGDDKTRNLKAQDVVDSFKRLAVLGEDGMYWMAEGLIEGLDEYGKEARFGLEYGTTDTKVAGLTAVDDHTVQIRLTRPFGPLVNLLAHPSFSILPGEAMDTWAAQLRERAVGTGRYRLNAVAEGSVYVFKTFDGHREGSAPYQRVTFTRRDYWNEFLGAFRDGTIAETPVWANFWDSVVQDGELAGELAGIEGTPARQAEHGYYFLSFNMDDEVWGALDDDGRALRKAVSLALNRREASEQELAGFWAGAQEQTFPAGMEFGDIGGGDYGRHDLKLAKEVLGASKYKGGKHPDTGQPLELNFACMDFDFYTEFVEPLEEALDELGMKLNVRYLDGELYRDVVVSAGDDLFCAGWFLDYPDPQNFLQLFWSENAGSESEINNTARYRSDEFDGLYLQLEGLLPTMENRDKRRELVAQMAEVLTKDRPTIPLVHSIEGIIRANSVDWPQMPRQTYNDIRFLKPSEDQDEAEGEE